MYTEPKFFAMKETSKAKRMAELLRVIILQLGDDVPRARRDYETYAGWMNLPESEHLTGKNQAQMIDLYKTFRMRAGRGFERDVYLEQEPGDREGDPTSILKLALSRLDKRPAAKKPRGTVTITPVVVIEEGEEEEPESAAEETKTEPAAEEPKAEEPKTEPAAE